MTQRSLVLHWMFLGSLLVLILNDHVFKSLTPGPVTGKLSDVAGLVMFPILAISTLELLLRRQVSSKTVWGVTLGTAIVFASVQLIPSAAHGYQVIISWVHWLLSGASGTPLPVRHVADAWDNIALPGVLVAPYLHAKRSRLALSSSVRETRVSPRGRPKTRLPRFLTMGR